MLSRIQHITIGALIAVCCICHAVGQDDRPSPSQSRKGVSVISNPAELSIEMLPETKVVVGSRVFFRISAKKPGFLILVDIDSTGKVTQIYPSPDSLMAGRGKPNANF